MLEKLPVTEMRYGGGVGRAFPDCDRRVCWLGTRVCVPRGETWLGKLPRPRLKRTLSGPCLLHGRAFLGTCVCLVGDTRSTRALKGSQLPAQDKSLGCPGLSQGLALWEVRLRACRACAEGWNQSGLSPEGP